LIIFDIFYGLFGWLVGVAINHAADLLPKRGTLRRQPHCLSCGAPRPWMSWSGVLAVLSGQRQCSQCGQSYKSLPRSILVELATPALFIFLLRTYGFSGHLILVSIYTAILILVTVTDLEHRLIFNVVILPSILLALVAAFFTPGLYWPSSLVGGAAAFIITYLIALLGVFLFGYGAFGAGDVTLSIFLGLILGFPYILFSLVFGIFLAGFVSFLLLITRRVNRKVYIPYGPFLTITGWIMLIWGEQIWQYYFF
jgi:leader peptidase (prepilin peptidase)/N-methyltransferase